MKLKIISAISFVETIINEVKTSAKKDGWSSAKSLGIGDAKLRI